MEDLIVIGSKGQYFIPSVNFAVETGECEIAGESFLEDTAHFYNPLIQWLKEYTETGKQINFAFKLTYFNTSSSRCILDILNILKTYKGNGSEVHLSWHFDKKDRDMKEEVEDFMIEAGVEIELVPH